MNSFPTVQHRVLAVHPASRNFGYVILESPARLIDWGTKTTRTDKDPQTVAEVKRLLAHYTPDVFVVRDCTGSRHGKRVRELVSSLRVLAVLKGLRVYVFSRQSVRTVFGAFHAQTREEIARILADQLPELAPWLPRHRKPWMNDDYHMPMFDAAALALTYFYSRPMRSGKV